MLVGIVVILFGVGAIVLGGLQFAHVLPMPRHRGGLGSASGFVNVGIGLILIALGALRLIGLA